jgi:hypothetical protein
MPDEIASIEIRPATAADAAAIAEVRRASWFAAYDGLIPRELIDRATTPGQLWTPPAYLRTIVAIAPTDGQRAHVSAGTAVDDMQAVVGFASFGPERTVDSAIPPPNPLPAGPASQADGALPDSVPTDAIQSAPMPSAPSPGDPRPGDPRPGDPRPSDPTPGGSRHGAPSPGGSSPGGSRRGNWRHRELRLGRKRSRQTVLAGPLTPAGLAGETGEVYAIYLAPAAWSTGAGRALMDTALNGLRAGGYQRVVLWVLTGNARARRFYEKAGFAPDGATNVLAALGGVEELRYARPLAP